MSRFCDVKELKKILVDRNIDTTTQFAAVSGVNRNTLADILNEKAQPSADVMIRICDALDIEPEKAGSIFFAQKLT